MGRQVLIMAWEPACPATGRSAGRNAVTADQTRLKKWIRSLTSRPHDALFRALVSDTRRADTLIRDHFPDELRHLLKDVQARPTAGSHVNRLLKQSWPDAVFEYGGSPGRPDLLVILEHLRAVRLRELEKLAGYSIDARRACNQEGHRPVIVPFLVSTGRTPVRVNWVERHQHGHLSVMKSGLNWQHFLWLAAPETPYAKLASQTDVRGVLGALCAARSGQAPMEVLEMIFEDLSGLPRWDPLWGMTYLYGLSTFGLDPKVLDTLIREVDPKRKEAEMPTMFQEMIREHKAEALARGRAEGRVEGRMEGRVEGRVEGGAKLLLRQLRRRFGTVPADVTARIRSASMSEVERWGEAILDARSLDDLFRKPSTN